MNTHENVTRDVPVALELTKSESDSLSKRIREP